jgi:ketosteroid isomerase-like protein
MNNAELATKLVELCRAGKFIDAVDSLYAEDVVSVEAMDFQGLGREMRGKDAVLAKNKKWFTDNDVHSAQVNGPFLSPEYFAVNFVLDWTPKASGECMQMSELAIYTVADGKIVREEFLYGAF